MHKVINLIKSKFKKYLPDRLYFLLYTIFKYIEYALSNHSSLEKKELSLVSFTKPTFKEVIVDDIHFQIKLDPNNGLVDKEIYAKGVWEKDLLLEMRKHITEESTCLDIGANIGQHTLYLSSVSKKGKVYAFEPIPKLAQQIEESAKANHMENVTVCNFGLSNKNEILDIYLNNLNMGNTTFKKRLGASDVVKAETKTFDSFWNIQNPIHFLKMDVEGYEYFALLGMKENILAHKPVMIIEFSPIFYNAMNISSTEFLHFIFDLGYTVADLDDNRRTINKTTIPAFLERVTSQTNILCLPVKGGAQI